MSLEISLLHSLLRRADRTDRLCERLGEEPEQIVRALRALARQGLVMRSASGPRLTLAGFAVAVASRAKLLESQPRRAKRLMGVPRIPRPTVRRRSAA